MLLELQDLFQDVVGAPENLVHPSVSVAVLEALAAAARADVVATDTRKVQRLGPAKGWAHRRRRARARRFRGFCWARNILRTSRLLRSSAEARNLRRGELFLAHRPEILPHDREINRV